MQLVFDSLDMVLLILPKPLLTSCIPNLQFYSFSLASTVFNLQRFDHKINSLKISFNYQLFLMVKT